MYWHGIWSSLEVHYSLWVTSLSLGVGRREMCDSSWIACGVFGIVIYDGWSGVKGLLLGVVGRCFILILKQAALNTSVRSAVNLSSVYICVWSQSKSNFRANPLQCRPSTSLTLRLGRGYKPPLCQLHNLLNLSFIHMHNQCLQNPLLSSARNQIY